jgi:1,6-anhydro-N-acetylmuramate kinase
MRYSKEQMTGSVEYVRIQSAMSVHHIACQRFADTVAGLANESNDLARTIANAVLVGLFITDQNIEMFDLALHGQTVRHQLENPASNSTLLSGIISFTTTTKRQTNQCAKTGIGFRQQRLLLLELVVAPMLGQR